MLFAPASCPRLIVKIGSALLVDEGGAVRRDWLAGIAADIAARCRAGQQVAVVSSGAIALGARRLGLAKGGRASLEDAQAAAATGQIALSQVWAEVLGAEGLTAAQILVTLDDLEHRRASGMGSGGMVSKIAAARIANSAGASLAIASGRIERPLSADARHTLFTAERGASARKAWLAGGLTAKGRLTIDAGAVRALAGGASLLAAGVTGASGDFARGDILDIAGPDGRTIARGLSEYTAADAQAILGLGRDAQEAALGYAPRAAIVHRDHLVLL